jgi:hypothetical protein
MIMHDHDVFVQDRQSYTFALASMALSASRSLTYDGFVAMRVNLPQNEGDDSGAEVSLILSSSHDANLLRTQRIHHEPILHCPEMSNGHGFGAPETSGAFHAAHHFAMHNATFNDVQGNYYVQRDHFVACVDHH